MKARHGGHKFSKTSSSSRRLTPKYSICWTPGSPGSPVGEGPRALNNVFVPSTVRCRDFLSSSRERMPTAPCPLAVEVGKRGRASHPGRRSCGRSGT